MSAEQQADAALVYFDPDQKKFILKILVGGKAEYVEVTKPVVTYLIATAAEALRND